MNTDGFLKGARSLFKGVLEGILAVLMIVAALIVVSVVARADEDIHLHMDIDTDMTVDIMYLEAVLGIAFDDAIGELYAVDCSKTNRKLQYMLDRIVEDIAEHPEFIDIYAPTIVIILESWCTE